MGDQFNIFCVVRTQSFAYIHDIENQRSSIRKVSKIINSGDSFESLASTDIYSGVGVNFVSSTLIPDKVYFVHMPIFSYPKCFTEILLSALWS